jgi:hypothetical protein
MTLKLLVWISVQAQIVASWAGGMEGCNEENDRPVLDKPFC